MSDGPSTEAIIGLSIATGVPGLWSLFVPSVMDQAPYNLEVVRLQQTKATVASLALGVAASSIARKPWPFLVAVFAVGLLLWEWETTRRRSTS